MPGNVLSAFISQIESSHQVGTNYPQFRDEGTEANKGYVTHKRLHSKNRDNT